MTKEKILAEATLCFFIRGEEVLLAKKLRKIGVGCWNGYGGGIKQKDKDLTAAAIRECREECGVKITRENMKKVSIMDFHIITSDNKKFVCRVHIFLVTKWKGNPRETEEMSQPTWFKITDLPLKEMMPADPFWIPQALCGAIFTGKASYGPYQKQLVKPVVLHLVDRLS